jgi:DNA-binding MarR family transcriptional regulator
MWITSVGHQPSALDPLFPVDCLSGVSLRRTVSRMDGDVQPTARPASVYQTSPTDVRVQVRYLTTTSGQLLEPGHTAQLREQLVKDLERDGDRIVFLDLSGAIFTPGSLQELLLPLARRVHASEAGPRALVVIAEDRGVADFVRMLAVAHDLPLYVSNRPQRVAQAEPLGRLTTTEKQTIEALGALGGSVTVATFAQQLGLQITAAGNRLTNLSKRGYLYREPRSRREGDAFIDPRQDAHKAWTHYWCQQLSLHMWHLHPAECQDLTDCPASTS